MCFRKAFHLILMYFYFLSSMLWGVFTKIRLFSKQMFFRIFDWSNLFFNQSKSFLKFFVSLYLVWLIEIVFRSIEHCESVFFFFLKMDLDFFKSNFFKSFSIFSLSPIQTWLHLRVLSFLIFPFARFLSPNTGKTFLPFFLFLFSHFMHFHAFLIWEFQTMHKLGFLMIQAKFWVIDHWVLLLYCYIHDLCWKIW